MWCFLLPIAACLASTGTICIDPGHPSEVGRGTHGRHVSEIHVAWEVAKRLETILEGKGYKVVMTKHSEKEFVKNRERADIANRSHADLMVRLHCDAAAGSGFTTYFPDRQGTSDGMTGPDPALIARIAPIAKRFNAVLARPAWVPEEQRQPARYPHRGRVEARRSDRLDFLQSASRAG